MIPRTMLAAFAIGASLVASPALAQPISTEQIKKIVASPERSAADRTNDLRRHPEQILEFIAIRPGIVALDGSAGGGYTTELLARSIGPTGKVYGQSRPRDPNQAPTSSSVPEGNTRPNLAPVAAPGAPPAAPRPSPVALADRDASLHEAGIPAAPIVALSRPFEDPVPSDLSFSPAQPFAQSCISGPCGASDRAASRSRLLPEWAAGSEPSASRTGPAVGNIWTSGRIRRTAQSSITGWTRVFPARSRSRSMMRGAQRSQASAAMTAACRRRSVPRFAPGSTASCGI